MYEDLDDQALYGSDERYSERLRDEFAQFYSDAGFNMFLDEPTGTMQRWYPGMGYPEPEKELTNEDRDEQLKFFFVRRILNEAYATLALKKAKEFSYDYSVNVWTYDRKGTVEVRFNHGSEAEEIAERFG